MFDRLTGWKLWLFWELSFLRLPVKHNTILQEAAEQNGGFAAVRFLLPLVQRNEHMMLVSNLWNDTKTLAKDALP